MVAPARAAACSGSAPFCDAARMATSLVHHMAYVLLVPQQRKRLDLHHHITLPPSWIILLCCWGMHDIHVALSLCYAELCVEHLCCRQTLPSGATMSSALQCRPCCWPTHDNILATTSSTLWKHEHNVHKYAVTTNWFDHIQVDVTPSHYDGIHMAHALILFVSWIMAIISNVQRW